MSQETNTRYKCDFPGCKETVVGEEDGYFGLPEGWVAIDIRQGGDPRNNVILDSHFCGPDHAKPQILASLGKLETI
jgi:hypothetical protein